MTDDDILEAYNDTIWRFIPTLWRYWWIDNVKRLIPTLCDVTIESPPTFFKDITGDINDWNVDIKSFSLPCLARACNKHLLPTYVHVAVPNLFTTEFYISIF